MNDAENYANFKIVGAMKLKTNSGLKEFYADFSHFSHNLGEFSPNPIGGFSYNPSRGFSQNSPLNF